MPDFYRPTHIFNFLNIYTKMTLKEEEEATIQAALKLLRSQEKPNVAQVARNHMLNESTLWRRYVVPVMCPLWADTSGTRLICMLGLHRLVRPLASYIYSYSAYSSATCSPHIGYVPYVFPADYIEDLRRYFTEKSYLHKCRNLEVVQ